MTLRLACLLLCVCLCGCGRGRSPSESDGRAQDEHGSTEHTSGAPIADAHDDATSPSATDPYTASTTDAPRWRAPNGPAPWDDGWPREWFYAHPRPADDWRWARMAQHVGHRAPALESLAEWRHTAPVDLDDLRGDVVLLEFWATWCPDCRASMPTLHATAERLADAPFRVLQVCARKGGERHAEIADDWGLELPGALDARGATEAAYDVPRWPFYVLIDPDGVVRATGIRTAHVGAAVDLMLERYGRGG